MSRGQRFTFLAIAVLIAIVAFVVLADTSEDDGGSQTAATATPTPAETQAPTEAAPGEETPTATPTPKPKPPPPPLLRAGRVRELEFDEGDRIRFRVISDVDEEIHVHCYDITRDVPAGRAITVSFEASITGICEVELHGSGEPIGELRVQPR
jgi:hypothetical protein